MKRWLVCLPILLLSIAANAAPFGDKFCRDSNKGNTEYAQWGLQLRAEMLSKCGSKPSKSCEGIYINAIETQSKKNLEQITKNFPGKNAHKTDAYAESMMRSVILEKSARDGLAGAASAKEIAEFYYRLCRLPAVDSQPAARAYRGAPMPPPMMPMEPSISSRLSPMQPEMSGGSPFGSCNNYNYLGPNGQAVYCQQCCHGDGNCQTICN